ncbi:Uncharacterized protein TCM_028953 [Theobroma cacao]|uniref:Serine-threonine/tyrosine-protein kinase catalytic domain-containing protein n=1 Tax=Theobroma cacao TaxID=3641 RepID=A0A061GCV5_THECC|nr:Uncharacterized protein TCM_028953 [Theobroma cacao]
MTNSFERILGKEGFGIVFHGYLDDTQVTIKMLSHSSVQGYRQFQAEVELLLRVHHRNLTSLIMYCKEGINMRLIYEYMAKGNLAEHLSSRLVILEINNERTHISQWVGSMLSRGDIKNIVDPRLQGDFDVNSIWKAVEVAMTSVSPSSTKRPTMTQEAVEIGFEPVLRHANLTNAQMKQQEEDIAKRYKVLSCLQSAVSGEILARIMHLENPKEVWDHLKDEFQGSERTKQIQALNLTRQFEMLSMDEDEFIRIFPGRLMGIVHQLRLLGKAMPEDKLVSKMLVSLPEKYESKCHAPDS